MKRFLPAAIAVFATAFLSPVNADPLHAIAHDAYWHHESNFIFPATLAGFTRAGAPQEVDGSTTVKAYYAQGSGDARVVVEIWVFPSDVGIPDDARYSAERAGWRLAVRAPLSTDYSRFEQLIRAFQLERLGETDTRCPNAGCGD